MKGIHVFLSIILFFTSVLANGQYFRHLTSRSPFIEPGSEEAIKMAANIRKKYPDRVAVILTKKVGSTLPDLDKTKFLVPHDLTFGQFTYIIRKRMDITPEQGIFLNIDGHTQAPGMYLLDYVDTHSYFIICK